MGGLHDLELLRGSLEDIVTEETEAWLTNLLKTTVGGLAELEAQLRKVEDKSQIAGIADSVLKAAAAALTVQSSANALSDDASQDLMTAALDPAVKAGEAICEDLMRVGSEFPKALRNAFKLEQQLAGDRLRQALQAFDEDEDEVLKSAPRKLAEKYEENRSRDRNEMIRTAAAYEISPGRIDTAALDLQASIRARQESLEADIERLRLLDLDNIGKKYKLVARMTPAVPASVGYATSLAAEAYLGLPELGQAIAALASVVERAMAEKLLAKQGAAQVEHVKKFASALPWLILVNGAIGVAWTNVQFVQFINHQVYLLKAATKAAEEELHKLSKR